MIEFKEPLYYSSGYKHQCKRDFTIRIKLKIEQEINTHLLNLKPVDDTWSELTIRRGYSCDGASGPTIDIPACHVIMGAFVHDALCELARKGFIPTYMVKDVDVIAYECWKASGMWHSRAGAWHEGLKKFDFYVDPKNVKKIKQSPSVNKMLELKNK